MEKSKFLCEKESSVRTGWMERCAKKFRYPPDVKVNNWLDERADLGYVMTHRPLLYDYDHNYKTTALTSFKHPLSYTHPELIKTGVPILSKESHAFPGHQPELDLPQEKLKYKSYETTSRAAYTHPDLQRRPLATLPVVIPVECEKKMHVHDRCKVRVPLQQDNNEN